MNEQAQERHTQVVDAIRELETKRKLKATDALVAALAPQLEAAERQAILKAKARKDAGKTTPVVEFYGPGVAVVGACWRYALYADKTLRVAAVDRVPKSFEHGPRYKLSRPSFPPEKLALIEKALAYGEAHWPDTLKIDRAYGLLSLGVGDIDGFAWMSADPRELLVTVPHGPYSTAVSAVITDYSWDDVAIAEMWDLAFPSVRVAFCPHCGNSLVVSDAVCGFCLAKIKEKHRGLLELPCHFAIPVRVLPGLDHKFSIDPARARRQQYAQAAHEGPTTPTDSGPRERGFRALTLKDPAHAAATRSAS